MEKNKHPLLKQPMKRFFSCTCPDDDWDCFKHMEDDCGKCPYWLEVELVKTGG